MNKLKEFKIDGTDLQFTCDNKGDKLLIIDIETSGFSRKDNSIIEIAAIELNINTGEYRALFNSLVKDNNFDVNRYEGSHSYKKTRIKPEDILKARPLLYYKDYLQQLFNCYAVGAFSLNNFDFKWLESRGFTFPNKFDFQLAVRRIIFKENKEFKYRGEKFSLRASWFYFLNRIENKQMPEKNKLTVHDGVFHRALYDTILETKILYLLISKFGFQPPIFKRLFD